MLTTIVAGHLCVDLTPQIFDASAPQPGQLVVSGPLAISVGGCVGNTGAAMTALGVPVMLEAAVGRDELGRLAADLLAAVVGRDRLRLVHSIDATSYSVVIDPPGGDRAFWHHVGANSSFVDATLDGADVLHLGYPTALSALTADNANPLRQLLANARAAGLTTSIDLSSTADPESTSRDWAGILADVLPLTDLISPSVDDLRHLIPELRDAGPGESAQWLVERGVAVAMVTDGPKGAITHFGSERRFQEAGPALRGQSPPAAPSLSASPRIADGRTTGAGDTASAGMLAAAAHGLPVERWADVAVASASAHVAGIPLSPSLLHL